MRNAKFRNKKYSIVDFFYFLFRNFLLLIAVFCLGFVLGTLVQTATSYSLYTASGDIEVTSQTVEQKTIQDASPRFCDLLKTTNFLENCSEKMSSEGIHHSDDTNFTWKELFDGIDIVAQTSESGDCLLVLSYKSKDCEQPIQVAGALTSYAPLYLIQYYPNLIFSVVGKATELGATTVTDKKLPLVVSLFSLTIGIVGFALLDLDSDLIFDCDDLEACAKKVYKMKNSASFFNDLNREKLPDFETKTFYIISFSSKKTTAVFLASFNSAFKKNAILLRANSSLIDRNNAIICVLFERGFSTFDDLEKLQSSSIVPDFCFFDCKVSAFDFLQPLGFLYNRHLRKENV